MSNEYVVLGLKRFVATLFFKHHHPMLSNADAIKAADKLLKDLDL